MSRFLFVVPPLSGHVYPAAAVARALAGSGHQVAWVGSEAYLRPRIGPDAVVYPTGLRPYRGQRDRGIRALESLWTGFLVPFTRAILPAVDAATTDYRPDTLVVDQHALAGALTAYRHGLPWASLAPTMMELTRPWTALPTVDAWMREQLTGLWREAGLPGEPVDDLRFSPHLVISFTSPELTAGHTFPDHFVLVGAALAERVEGPDFDWSTVDRRYRLLVVSTGTLAADLSRDFFPRVAEAVRPLAGTVQAIFHTTADALPDRPDNVLVAPRLPVLELLAVADGMLCHGGMSTAYEALAHGLPLVVAPIRYDQPIVADQVVAAGAGVRVRFGRATADELRAAVTAILDEPGYRESARRVRDSFVAAGGATAAAAHLAALAEGRP